MHLLPPWRKVVKRLKKQIEKVRRVHSGDADSYLELFEVFDLATSSFVPYDTQLKPEMIEVEEDEEVLLE